MSNRNVLVVIPARLASSRFPGKPLAMVGGKPLIWYAWHVASTWPRAARVVVASPDASILDAARAFGADVEESSPHYRNGSQRAFEVFLRDPQYQTLVNLQVDEPDISHSMLDNLVSGERWMVPIRTLSCPFPHDEPSGDPNEVKVVRDYSRMAMYFTRQPLPGSFRHIGVYGFSGEYVCEIASVPRSLYASAESLEQLDWMFREWAIQAIQVNGDPISINTPRDMERFKAILEAKQA